MLVTATLSAQQPRADLVLLNGKVITVDANDRIAQAVAIAGNRIIAVGTTAEVLRTAGPATRRIDLGGRTLTPGLIDAHVHFLSGGVDELRLIDLSYPAVKTIGDALAAVKQRVAASGPGEWVQGRGWDEGKLAERRRITAADLDAVSPANPVWLEQTTGHYGVANSLALKLAGITRETKDPAGGTIDHNPDGSPNGVLKEGAQGIVRRLMPGATADDRKRAARAMAKAFNAEGMTAGKEPNVTPEQLDMYREAVRAGEFPVRLFTLWSGGRGTAQARRVIADHAATSRPYESTGDDRIIEGGVKLYIDGSGGARTAWLYDDWNKDWSGTDAGNKGYPTSDPDTVRAIIRMYHDAGMHVSVHSIGDHGIDWVVDTYDQAMKENPKKGLRHGIIHANIPTDHAIEVMARLQKDFDAAYPEPSATFAWWIGDTYAGNFGPSRAPRLNPFATFVKKGIIWANGSDFGVTPFAARYGLWSAIAREPMLGAYADQVKDPFGRAESVDVHVALKAITIWAAHQMFLEKKIGSVEVGKYADLAVWDRDFYSVPTPQLKDAQCLLTIFDGKVVFQRDGTKF